MGWGTHVLSHNDLADTVVQNVIDYMGIKNHGYILIKFIKTKLRKSCHKIGNFSPTTSTVGKFFFYFFFNMSYMKTDSRLDLAHKLCGVSSNF